MAEIFTLTLLVIKWLIAIILGVFTLLIIYGIGALCVIATINFFKDRQEKYLE